MCSVTQSCQTLCDSTDCSLPDSSCHGIFQEIILGVGCYFLLQGIFPIHGLNPRPLCILHCHSDSLTLPHLGSPVIQQSHCWTYTLRKPTFKKCMHPSVHCNTIYNSQNMEGPECPMIDQWIKNMWYI